MADEPNVAEVMDRLRNGDQQAATDVFHRFLKRLIGLARSRLDVNIQRKVAPEDIAQSAFQSFFRRQRAGELDIASWDNLWSLLAVITIHKCGHQIRYYRAGRRDVNQEQSALRFSEDSAAGWQAVAQEPTPSHAMRLTESVEELMQGLDAREGQILILSLQGATVDEISQEAACSQRTVRRVLEHVRSRLEKQCACD
jgi:RNA polymerase sigma-70 factor (ECF subfamily)